MSGQLLILKVIDRPETKVHTIEHKQLQKSRFIILLSLVKVLRVEGLIRKTISKSSDILVVDDDVLGLISYPLAG